MKKIILLIFVFTMLGISSCSLFTKKEKVITNVIKSEKINPIGGEAKGEGEVKVGNGTSSINFNN